MAKTMIDQMVDQFLGWKLPKDFHPDAGISFRSVHEHDSPHWPIGTNLLTANQAKEMIKHMLAGVVPPDCNTTEEEGEAYMIGYFDGEAAVLSANSELNGAAEGSRPLKR
jgi:hypothetical protein